MALFIKCLDEDNMRRKRVQISAGSNRPLPRYTSYWSAPHIWSALILNTRNFPESLFIVTSTNDITTVRTAKIITDLESG